MLLVLMLAIHTLKILSRNIVFMRIEVILSLEYRQNYSSQSDMRSLFRLSLDTSRNTFKSVVNHKLGWLATTIMLILLALIHKITCLHLGQHLDMGQIE